MKIIKLTSKKRFTLEPDSSPDVPVNEEVEIPPNHYGEFYIRKKFGRKGITVPSSPFPANWTGVPNITLVHGGANEEEFLVGDEIGELHIRYNPPSPFVGDCITLEPPFCFKRYGDSKLRVITKDVRMFECEELLIYSHDGDHERVNANVGSEDDWKTIDYVSDFKPSSVMLDYTQIQPPTKRDLVAAHILSPVSLKSEHEHTYCDSAEAPTGVTE